jgi:hypothetical protein
MPGFLNSSKETNIANLFDILHSTFARQITVYKNDKKTLIASSPQYNSIYNKTNTGSKSNLEFELVSKTINARVYYLNSEEELLQSAGSYNNGSQNKIIFPKGSVKIIIPADGFDFLKEARRVEFDGKRFAIKSDGNPSGFTYNQFYTFYLTPIDE